MLKTQVRLSRLIWMVQIWCVTTAVLIAMTFVGLNLLYNAYYFLQSPTRPLIQVPNLFVKLQTIAYGLPSYSYWSLVHLVAAILFVAVTARCAGWRTRPTA